MVFLLTFGYSSNQRQFRHLGCIFRQLFNYVRGNLLHCNGVTFMYIKNICRWIYSHPLAAVYQKRTHLEPRILPLSEWVGESERAEIHRYRAIVSSSMLGQEIPPICSTLHCSEPYLHLHHDERALSLLQLQDARIMQKIDLYSQRPEDDMPY